MNPLARDPLIDALKAAAALCILLHHALLYGPLAQQAQAAAPALAQALQQQGRLAVQVFLVLGGWLALQSLQRSREGFGAQCVRRHLRLALPMLAAVLLTGVAYLITAQVLPEELPQDRSLRGLIGQFAAHALLVHGVLGVESLSVGVWYVAIDWQLFVVLAGAMHLCRHQPPLLGPMLALLCAASAWVFNRWGGSADAWAPYFLASYGLGALAAMGGAQRWWALAACAVALSLAVDFRLRLVLALGLALLLHLRGLAAPAAPAASSASAGGVARRVLAWLAERSYALFLVHYAVLLLVNAWVATQGGPQGWAGVALILAASLLLAQGFHAAVERPLARWRSPLPSLVPALALLLGLLVWGLAPR